ncbi:MAG: winged helix-turn-helix domain-containing protein, partial [Rhodanobacteraceae bacterium]
GSIAAAGRAMGMSYKRAWQLVDGMNRMFRSPLVDAGKGGAHGGGARLTKSGANLLARYRALQSKTEAAATAELAAFVRAIDRR